MRKRKTTDLLILLIPLSLLFDGCLASRKIRISGNKQMEAVIQDYYKNNRMYIRKYSIFTIEKRDDIDSQLQEIVYHVLPEIDTINFITVDTGKWVERIPNNSFNFRGKLFLWREKSEPINDSLINSLYKRGMVDSSAYKYKLGILPIDSVNHPFFTIDESLKGSTYIFCKSNPTKILKRIKSSIWLSPDNPILRVDCK